MRWIGLCFSGRHNSSGKFVLKKNEHALIPGTLSAQVYDQFIYCPTSMSILPRFRRATSLRLQG